jgi:3',5'-cyclic AMP phosphodiesterase CpdA
MMRFAVIADVHGNYLALEAVLADIRTQGIADIVHLGDMASGPLDARRTMDALMGLDAVHVLGNHDRYLIDRPPEKMGSWDRPAHAQLEQHHLDWLRAVPKTAVFRDQVFLCHATPDNDEIYWLETVLPDGTVRMSALETIEKYAHGITQSLILCAHPSRPRGQASRWPIDRQSRQRRFARLSRYSSVSACRRSRHAGRALRHSRPCRSRLARHVPACAV